MVLVPVCPSCSLSPPYLIVFVHAVPTAWHDVPQVCACLVLLAGQVPVKWHLPETSVSSPSAQSNPFSLLSLSPGEATEGWRHGWDPAIS